MFFTLQQEECKPIFSSRDFQKFDPICKDDAGQTTLHLASKWGFINVVQMIVDNSATLGIDLNIKDNAGQTPFHLACRWCRFDVAKMFMENSVTLSIDLNTKDNEGQTPFQLASKSDCYLTPSIFGSNVEVCRHL